MNKYKPKNIEKKWQKFWEKEKLFFAKDLKKKKQYILTEFPYPSGDGLHAGHVRTYTALDIVSRMQRMRGFNVLYPIGWDAFGLPTENFAIKTGIHPGKITQKNITTFKKQMKSLGLSFDWPREINTSDPEYYKWTQWIFLQLYKHGLAYKKKTAINWCLSCKIGLANEEVVDGKCERCGSETEKKEKEQWMLAITKYADRLDKDLDKVDFLEKIKTQQRNWIGRSTGVLLKFEILNSKFEINPKSKIQNPKQYTEVFTTRVDTIFGATYVVLAPEHELVGKLKERIKNWKDAESYIKKAKKKSDLERTELIKDKTGVELKGIKAINPATKKEISIFIADYVLASYGTGAVMAVPAHDQRDFEFAKKYKLPIKMVVCPNYPKPICPVLNEAFEGDGCLIDSGKFNGMDNVKAQKKITKFVGGKIKTMFKLRDWVFSRQRYWGEPIPLIFCEKCKKLTENSKFEIRNPKQIQNTKYKIQNEGERINPGWIAVNEKDLPLKLPYVENYKPTDTGESPLANVKKWVNVKCPKCGGKARRETDVMPNWAGSSWYFLRYCDPKNKKSLADDKKLKYWMPVDWYNGGMEHTTLHLLYSRFWHKFLYDIGMVSTIEPYQKRTSQGMVLAHDGRKMSKSFSNVINPDDIVKEFGADTLRLYEMFMGPFDQAIAWDSKALNGMYRFLNRVWDLQYKIRKTQKHPSSPRLRRAGKKINSLLHKTIKKVSEDIVEMKFNTAIATLMTFVNELSSGNFSAKGGSASGGQFSIFNFQLFLKLLAPFAPHICEEIWFNLGNKKSIFLEKWPEYDSKFIKEETFELVIQVNGKVRDRIEAEMGIFENGAKKIALDSKKIKKHIEGKKIRKIIFVKNKLVNIVI